MKKKSRSSLIGPYFLFCFLAQLLLPTGSYGVLCERRIDKDYSHALVGSGSADYLWILSRTPSLDGDAKVAILDEIHRWYSENERVTKARQITERNHAKSPNEIASNHRM